jgi:hypothetical protein
MGRSAAQDVRFDFDGSLQLARRLWQLADQVDQFTSTRVALANDALAEWLGPFGTQFGERITTEYNDLGTGSRQLRTDATGWATCWAQAINEQNRRLRSREVQRVENDRSTLDSVVGFITGHDDLPPEPPEYSPPTPPSFNPTGTFVRYDSP